MTMTGTGPWENETGHWKSETGQCDIETRFQRLRQGTKTGHGEINSGHREIGNRSRGDLIWIKIRLKQGIGRFRQIR